MTAFDVDIMTSKRGGVFHADMTHGTDRPEIPAFAGMSEKKPTPIIPAKAGISRRRPRSG